MTPRTLTQLVEAFFAYYAAEVAAGRIKPATVAYYRFLLAPWLATIKGSTRLADIRTHHLTARGGLTWHQIQSVQRLFTWARKQQILPASPFTDVEKPQPGRRERTLSRPEAVQLIRSCDLRPTRRRPSKRTTRKTDRPLGAAAIAGAPVRPLRWLLVAMCWLGARPYEMRTLRWRDYDAEARQFRLRVYKAKARRKDRMRERVLLVSHPYLLRVLAIWQQRRNPAPDDFVFLNSAGRPWSKDAICSGVRRARELAGLEGEDAVVAYTQRHTAATRAANPLDGSPGATLAQIAAFLGHASPRMTERYVNLKTDDMAHVAQKAIAATRRPRNQTSPPAAA